MGVRAKRTRNVAAVTIVALITSATADKSKGSSVAYGYDAVGRVATALYDDGACTVYAYDANGNRTSQTTTTSGAPQTPTWGTGSWGCFVWTPH